VREELPPEGPPRFELRVLPDGAEAAEAAARELVAACRDAFVDHGAFCPALSGGSTPRLLFRALVAPPFRSRVEWARARIFFVDERCVPPEDERSNYRLAKEYFLDPLRVPAENVFRMRGEEDPRRAARDYESLLKEEFGSEKHPPRFDFVLLGLGPDGHTASVFPETRAVEEKRRWVVANWVPKMREWRLTLTIPVLNSARRVVFLAVGKEKRAAVAAVLRAKRGSRRLPATLVRPAMGSLVWIVDEAAAADL
jgi:6-phosphogluconolactonase